MTITALMPTFNRSPIAFERGEGVWLWTNNNEKYLDFGSGIATNSLGHGNKHLVGAIAEQAAKVMHVSNLYSVPQASRLAERLVGASFADSVFFCNSGAEANEGLIKMVRRFQSDQGRPERYRMICFNGAFHGRSLATIAATGNPAYLKGFGPVVEGFDHVEPNDLALVEAAITPETAGILIEPVQGEGGIRVIPADFLQGLRYLCDKHGLVLAMDEVQTGAGRTGKMFAHQWTGVTPDILSVAKGIGGGFPLGAILATESLAKPMVPGTHGTTYGGNPLACTAGNAVLDVILSDGFFDAVVAQSVHLRDGLEQVVRDFPQLYSDVRGKGLLLGVKCIVSNALVRNALLDQRLLTVNAGDNVVRFVPPLIVSAEECSEAVERFRKASKQLAQADCERKSVS
ncbi:aspartate aminotransferase family protein [Agrobacterium sp. ICMP 6402]|uniref:aspartate aminotransferase family protein n=1 Tax=Agrobacterium sp. ICMP 6402 TaxID=2292443 RepID=UPI001295D680|nr:aspartate aminotransferase family protein [Agrobacterium sp. ICMP 6402]MQB12369.1 aspartate aminotransferase family protein [Agrobacterium sp. ICMP 6402]